MCGTGGSWLPHSDILAPKQQRTGIQCFCIRASPVLVGVVGLRVCTTGEAHLTPILVRVLDRYPTRRAWEPRVYRLALYAFQILPALGARLNNNLARDPPVDNDALPGLPVVLAGGGGGHR